MLAAKDAQRFQSYIEPEPNSGCWLWSGDYFRKEGYGRFFLDGRDRQAHRVSFEVANGVIPGGLCVLHRCDLPPCVNPAHLFLGTQHENVRDMVRKGREHSGPTPALQGERNAQAKLTERDVLEIRALHRSGFGYKRIAPWFRVHHTTIRNIVLRLKWRHVPA